MAFLEQQGIGVGIGVLVSHGPPWTLCLGAFSRRDRQFFFCFVFPNKKLLPPYYHPHAQLTTSSGRDIVRQIKEMLCYVAPDYVQELEKGDHETSKRYLLPGC